MRKLILTLLLLLCPALSYPQGARFDSNAVKVVSGFLAPIPGASITVCTSSGTGTPCSPVVPTNPVTLCTDSTCSVAASNPFLADANGNWGFWALPGTYKVSVTAAGATGQLLTVTLPCAVGVSCVSASANNAFTGNNTHSGTETFTGALNANNGGALSGTFTGPTTLSAVSSQNNVIFADQQAGADFCAKVVTAMGLLPAAGGTVNALGFQGAQACGSATTLSKSGVTYLLPANMTVTATAGVTITISGSDVSFLGSGDTTLFDFSTGTSANDNFHVSGSRVRIEKIQIKGNRVAGGTATCLSAFNSFTTIWVSDNLFLNCGGQGIYAFGFSDGHITRNRFTSTRTGGVFLDTGSSEVWVTENTFSGTNTSNTGGQGGISVNGNTSVFDSGFYVNFNKFLNTTGVPIQINSVSAAAGRITRNAEAIGNFIDTTLTSGEGISFTANQYRIIGNRVTNTCVTGILVFGVPSGVDSNVVIADNIVSDVSKCVSGNNYGIQFAYGGASLAKMRATDNIIFDDQGGSATTAGAINFFNSGGAGTIADAVVSGNISRGNISATTVTFSQASDAANVIQFGNSGTASGNTFLLGAALRGSQAISDQGAVCTNGELALSAGWQSTGSATVTAVKGNGQTCEWTITTGTTTAANPTVTDTLTNALPNATTVCEMIITGGNRTAAAGDSFDQTTLSATAPVFTFQGTPTAGGKTYQVVRRCGP